MKKYLSTLVMLSAGLVLALPPALAQNGPAGPEKTVKKTPVKKAASASKKTAANDDDGKEPDITGASATEFQCGAEGKLTIYHHASDDAHIALRWNKRLHRLTRVDTSTGANRFENRKFGLVWIDIPAKGMLLDSKKGQQLANDCKKP